MRVRQIKTGAGANNGAGAGSPYLKIDKSTKRFKRLVILAGLAQCSWQIVVLEAVDRLLDSELGPESPDR